MEYQQLIETMSADTYRSLKQAVELGKWQDGKALTREQRENTLQAIIAWGKIHLPETDRVGYIDKGHKEGDSCDPTTLTWKDQK
ncbi:MAG: DUF1315 domain-containing protein [Gammaproteobacteria bacterium]|nr:MAG: DUF1315 domain-containing protein [Gammaproteobacteria bacterium]